MQQLLLVTKRQVWREQVLRQQPGLLPLVLQQLPLDMHPLGGFMTMYAFANALFKISLVSYCLFS